MGKHYFCLAAVLGLVSAAPAATLVWLPANNNWDMVSQNWLNPNLAAQVAFSQGDHVTFDANGSAVPAVTLVGALTPASITVDAPFNYSLASTTGGKLLDVGSLTKKGAGRLTLDADNVISGPTVIEEGVLEIGSGAARGTLGTAPVTNYGTLMINRTGTLNLSNYLTGTGGLSVSLAGTVNMRGTNTLSGPYLHSSAVLNFLGAATIGNPASIDIAAAANCRFQISGGIDLGASCPVRFTGASGGLRGALQSMDGTNSVSGPILVGQGSGGLVQLMAMNAGTVLNVHSSITSLDPTPYEGPFYLRGTAGAGRLYGTINLPSSTLIKTDNGNWTVLGTGHALKDLLLAQGLLRLGIDQALPPVPLVIGQSAATAILDLAGFSQQFNTLNDVAGSTAIIANSSTISDSILTLSGGGVYGGSIQDSISNGTRTVGITLLSGAQQLTANCTFSGPTSIRGGGIALVGSGSIPNTAVIDISSGAALDVRLRTPAVFQLQTGQLLKGNGEFQIVGGLACQGTVELKLAKTGGTVTSDRVGSIETLTYGGTLKLLVSGDPLVPGDSVKLFDAVQYAGAFATIIPSVPGPGLAWNTTRLSIDGSLSVQQGTSPDPASLTVALLEQGTQLQLSWPVDRTGWMLQAQTNGWAETWHNVPNSTSTNMVYLPIDPQNRSVFYRLWLP